MCVTLLFYYSLPLFSSTTNYDVLLLVQMYSVKTSIVTLDSLNLEAVELNWSLSAEHVN
jgi:hypothetical protein